MFIKRFGALVLIILNVLFLASCKNAYQEFNNESKTFVSKVLNYYIATSKSLILTTEEEISY